MAARASMRFCEIAFAMSRTCVIDAVFEVVTVSGRSPAAAADIFPAIGLFSRRISRSEPAAWNASLALAETARSQSVFVWLAGHAERLAAGSRLATLALVYGAGIVVTALLSNDTTVIALTPAAVALVATTRRSRRQFCTRHWALIWSRPRLRIRQPGCGIELVGPYTVRRRARAHFWLKRLTWSGSTANSRGKALRTLLAQSNGYQKYRDHIVKAYSRCRLGILRQRGL